MIGPLLWQESMISGVLEPRIVLFRGLWQLCCKNVSLQQAALLTCLCFVCGALVRRFLLLTLLLSFLPFLLPSFFFSTAFRSVDAFLRFCFALGTCGVREELAGSCTDILLSVLRSPKQLSRTKKLPGPPKQPTPARPPGHPPAREPVPPPAWSDACRKLGVHSLNAFSLPHFSSILKAIKLEGGREPKRQSPPLPARSHHTPLFSGDPAKSSRWVPSSHGKRTRSIWHWVSPRHASVMRLLSVK